ncbi:MAG: serine/threonine protein kinase [Planctomycetota bacterium]
MTGKTSFSPVFKIQQGSDQTYGLVISAPIQHPKLGVVGFLGIGHPVTEPLTQILKSSRSGETGEALAVDREGNLISTSRFPELETGLPFFSESHANRIKFGSTKIQVDLAGKEDQRGVRSVFASRWMPNLGIGLVTKMDLAEANAPVSKLRSFVWTLFGLLTVTLFSTIVYRWYVYHLRKLARQSDLERKRLGSYELQSKVGEGGMGVVYRAHHALLRRPTAIKILPPEKSSQAAIQRFEREVQYTSQLKHPNTIAIYDYGRTENGLFYYAMEYLEGMNLEQLVRCEKNLPDGRIIHILWQACQSLQEAHAQGLIHRDIKPVNIMLCNQGGAVDTVKVLDFGMVRDLSSSSQNFTGALSGTPAYMAPECFTQPNDIDSRVDVFAIGAVGFYLLTGEPLFQAANLNELLKLHQSSVGRGAKKRIEKAVELSERKVSSDLVNLISRCVESDRENRIGSIAEVLKALSECVPGETWNRKMAVPWWRSSSNGCQAENSTETNPGGDSEFDDGESLETTQVFIPASESSQSKKSTDKVFDQQPV